MVSRHCLNLSSSFRYKSAPFYIAQHSALSIYHSFSYCNESFQCIWLLGSLYNTVLLLCVHVQRCAYHIQSHHTGTHGHVTSSHSTMLIDDCASACISLDGYRCRVRNNRWPSAIVRAFQSYDQPKSYLSGCNGRLAPSSTATGYSRSFDRLTCYVNNTSWV